MKEFMSWVELLGQPNMEHLTLIAAAKLLLRKAYALITLSHFEPVPFDGQTDDLWY